MQWIVVIVLDTIVVALAGTLCWRAVGGRDRRHAVGIASPVVHAALAAALAVWIVGRTVAGALS